MLPRKSKQIFAHYSQFDFCKTIIKNMSLTVTYKPSCVFTHMVPDTITTLESHDTCETKMLFRYATISGC